jgi:serine/threonine protein kinase
MTHRKNRQTAEHKQNDEAAKLNSAAISKSLNICSDDEDSNASKSNESPSGNSPNSLALENAEQKPAIPAGSPIFRTASIFKPEALVGKLLGDYEVLDVIGEGGMGYVYRANRLALNKSVAIKVLDPFSFERTPFAYERFKQEAKISASLRHANIVDVFDIGDVVIGENGDHFHYLVMELLVGEDLEERLEKSKTIELREVGEIVEQIGSALHAAHGMEYIHRDLKPANIFRAKGNDDRIKFKLLDFGIAKRQGENRGFTSADSVPGSLPYMSPEQFGTHIEIDARSDIFSFATIVYQCISGVHPFSANSPQSIMYKICKTTPKPIGDVVCELPKGIQSVLSKAHAKERGDRQSSVKDFADDFARALTREQPKSGSLENTGSSRGCKQLQGKDVASDVHMVLAAPVVMASHNTRPVYRVEDIVCDAKCESTVSSQSCDYTADEEIETLNVEEGARGLYSDSSNNDSTPQRVARAFATKWLAVAIAAGLAFAGLLLLLMNERRKDTFQSSESSLGIVLDSSKMVKRDNQIRHSKDAAIVSEDRMDAGDTIDAPRHYPDTMVAPAILLAKKAPTVKAEPRRRPVKICVLVSVNGKNRAADILVDGTKIVGDEPKVCLKLELGEHLFAAERTGYAVSRKVLITASSKKVRLNLLKLKR